MILFDVFLGKLLRWKIRCNFSRSSAKFLHVIFLSFLILSVFLALKLNLYEYVLALPFSKFSYPLNIDLPPIVAKVLNNEQINISPISLVNYPVILENSHLCKDEDANDDDISLLFVIKSSIENINQRNAIRESWAQENLVPFVTIKRLFLLGIHSRNTTLQSLVAKEHAQHKDILQRYFEDTYFNNTVKLFGGFEWATNNCRGAQFIMFVDDDFFVSTFNVIRFLQNLKVKSHEDFIGGFVYENAMPFRILNNKWYISLKEYPFRFWPPYPIAGSFLVSQQTAKRLYIGMQYVQLLRFDDVYVGIVAWKLGLRLHHLENKIFGRANVDELDMLVNTYGHMLLSIHNFKNVEVLKRLWEVHCNFIKNKGLT